MSAQMVPLQLFAKSNPGRTGFAGMARYVNCEPEMMGPEGRTPMPVYARGGLSRFSTPAGNGGIRGLFRLDDTTAYAVAGAGLFRIGDTGEATRIGSVPGQGPVYFERNRRKVAEVAMVSDGLAWIIENDTLKRLPVPASDTGIVAVQDVTVIDGILVFSTRDGQYHFTNIDNAFAITAIDYGTAEGNPDGLRRIFAHKRELWMFGDESIEVWAPTGNRDAPFQRLGGGYIERGCLAGRTVQLLDQGLLWVADDFSVRQANGYQASRVSTPYVERVIAGEPEALRSDIRGMTYVLDGHDVYTISGTTFTLRFDTTTGAWTDLSTYGSQRWRAENAISFAGKVIVGDIAEPRLYEVSNANTTDDDLPIVMSVTFPTVAAYPRAIVFYEIRFDVVPGVGLSSVTLDRDKLDPSVMLRWSDDGGESWSPTLRRPVGRQGNGTFPSARFNRLGQSRERGRIIEFSCVAGVFRGLFGGSMMVGQVTNP